MLKPLLDNMQNQMKMYQGENSIVANYYAPPRQQPKPKPPTPQVPEEPKNSLRPQFNVPSPTHPHQALSLPEVQYWKPILFKVGSAQKIISTLEQNYSGCGGTLDPDQKATIEAWTKMIEDPEKISQHEAPANSFTVLEKLFGILPDNKIFPWIDLVRLLVLHPTIGGLVVNNKHIIQNLVSKLHGDSVLGPLQLTTLRLLANMFSFEEGGKLISRDLLSSILKALTQALNLEKTSQFFGPIRGSAVVLAYNLSLWLNRDDSDETASVISSVLFHLPNEEDNSNVWTWLMTLGHLIYTNDDGIALVAAMGLDLTKFAESENPKIRTLVGELKLLLN